MCAETHQKKQRPTSAMQEGVSIDNSPRRRCGKGCPSTTPHVGDAGNGCPLGKRAHVGDAGMGVHRKRAHVGDAGMGGLFEDLTARLRHASVCAAVIGYVFLDRRPPITTDSQG